MDMIEKVAKAISIAERGWDNWEDLPDIVPDGRTIGRDDFRKFARVAIDAMRTPTDSMLEAAFGNEFTLSSKTQRDMAMNLYNAMIDEALQDAQ